MHSQQVLLQNFQGEKFVREAFTEVNIPLVAGKTLFRQLDVNLSGRILEDEFYGGASTYSAKAGWRPFDSLLLKASYGTSFRSPNLRENFLQPHLIQKSQHRSQRVSHSSSPLRMHLI